MGMERMGCERERAMCDEVFGHQAGSCGRAACGGVRANLSFPSTEVAITNSCPNNSRRLASELLAARYEDLMPRWFGLDLPFLAANVFRSCRACLR